MSRAILNFFYLQRGIMKKVNIVLTALAFVCAHNIGFAEEAKIAQTNPMDCSNMGQDMQQFAAQLSAANKRMFCGQFSDAQRSAAMQYNGKQDAAGNTMTANQAVQKVATDNNMMPTQKSPTGCPVK